MHLKIRWSSTKGRKMKGFRRKMKTKAGRHIINRQRRRTIGKGKTRVSHKTKRRDNKAKIRGKKHVS
jgi:hypothetical protein